MDPTNVSREEIMQGVVDLHSTLDRLVFWAEGWMAFILLATSVVVFAIAYQIRLKRRDSQEQKLVLEDVKRHLKVVQDHALLIDAQKTSMIHQLADALAVARLQASKVAEVAEQSTAVVVAKLEDVPERAATRVVEKLSADGHRH